MIWIHMGMAKAGSSHLQHYMAANADSLAEHGVLYPNLARHGVGHHPLVRSLSSPDVHHHTWAPVLKFVDNNPDAQVVLSSEGFETVDALAVRKALDGYPVRVVCYVREQVTRLPSWYTQNTKLGLNRHDFDRFFGLEDVRRKRMWNYDVMLQEWALAFGSENVRVRSLEPEVLDGGDLVSDFLSLLGMVADDFVGVTDNPSAARNASPSWKLVEALRAIQRVAVAGQLTKAERLQDPQIWSYLRRSYHLAQTSAGLLGWTEPGRYLSAAQNDVLVANYDQQLDRIEALGIDAKLTRKTLDPGLNREFLPSVEHIPADELAAFMVDLMSRVVRSMLKTPADPESAAVAPASMADAASELAMMPEPTPDPDVEGAPMTQAAPSLRAEVERLAPWHFNIEVAPGLWTQDCNPQDYDNADHKSVGVIDPQEMTPLLQGILPGGIAGRTFLDVGCNGGGYCFLAHSLGASRAHGFDVRDHWIDQANFIKSTRHPDAPGVEFQVADAKTFRHDGRFDVTLFKGVFYHLPDPISVLRDVCDLTDRAVIVDTVGRSDIPESAMLPWNESKTHVMSGVDGLAWFPGGPAAVKVILEWAGFPHMRTVEWKHGTAETRHRGRFRVVAFRDEADFEAYSGPVYQPA